MGLKNFNIFNKKVSLSNNKNWNNNILTRMLNRKLFNVDDIVNNIIYLSNDNEKIEITKDGVILKHYRDGHPMLQTYLVDDITLNQLKKL